MESEEKKNWEASLHIHTFDFRCLNWTFLHVPHSSTNGPVVMGSGGGSTCPCCFVHSLYDPSAPHGQSFTCRSSWKCPFQDTFPGTGEHKRHFRKRNGSLPASVRHRDGLKNQQTSHEVTLSKAEKLQFCSCSICISWVKQFKFKCE